MQTNKSAVFDLFRFQISPSSGVQMMLFEDFVSPEELKERKNEFFAQVIREITSYESRHGKKLPAKLYPDSDNIIYFKIGNKKDLIKYDDDLEELEDQSYPFVWVVVNNDPNMQIIAIQRNTAAFPSSKLVSNILLDNLGDMLRKYHLELSIAPISDKKSFWELIESYRNEIYSLDFRLIRPNMSRIASVLSEELRALIKSTNSNETHLKMTAPQGAVLENIKEDNAQLKSMGDYVADGGGFVTLKINGIERKTVSTDGTIRTVAIDEVTFKSSPDKVSRILSALLKV